MTEELDSKKNHLAKIAKVALVSGIIFLLACLFGEGVIGGWGSNNMCYPYLGCSSGFLGYDAIEHFLFGISAIWILLWSFLKFPKVSLMHGNRFKDFVILIALVALVSLLWEFVECAHDYFRIDILHQSLLNLRLHINLLDQPSNLDTMGDFTFAILGSFVSLFFVKIKKGGGDTI